MEHNQNIHQRQHEIELLRFGRKLETILLHTISSTRSECKYKLLILKAKPVYFCTFYIHYLILTGLLHPIPIPTNHGYQDFNPFLVFR